MNALKIRELRESLDFSRQELSALLCVSPSTVVRWEDPQSDLVPRGLEDIVLQSLATIMERTKGLSRGLLRDIILSTGLTHAAKIRSLLDMAIVQSQDFYVTGLGTSDKGTGDDA